VQSIYTVAAVLDTAIIIVTQRVLKVEQAILVLRTMLDTIMELKWVLAEHQEQAQQAATQTLATERLLDMQEDQAQ
jgi:hypothetical protein